MFNGNMKKIMKQAKDMQNKMMETQKELELMEVEGSSGGGAVKVVINGKKEVLSINIDSELMSDDKEILEDLIITCIKIPIISLLNYFAFTFIFLVKTFDFFS